MLSFPLQQEGERLAALLTELEGVNNSRERASQLFQWLISPIPAKAFFRYCSVPQCRAKPHIPNVLEFLEFTWQILFRSA